MRCLNPLFLAAGICLSGMAFGQANEFVHGEILVQTVATRVEGVGLLRAHSAIGARSIEHISKVGIERVGLPAGMDIRDAIAYYQGLPGVRWAEPNYIREITYSPNDPEYPTQSYLRQIKCDQAWSLTKGKTSVVVAVIDIGVDRSHPDLKGKLVPGWDFAGNDSDPSSTQSHGSHTSGIAAAGTDNGIGVSGTGFRTYVMPIRVGTSITASQSAKSMIFAADRGAKVISMSYAGSSPSSTEEQATNYAWGKGCVLVAAAGNLGQNIAMYPSGYPNVISVGSVDGSDERSSFSNGGAQNVDVAAPGQNILSTIPGGYGNLTGTSMSCPQVAGVCALLWSVAGPGTTNTQIRNVLQSQCDPVGDWLQYGRINALKAVQAMTSATEFVSDPVTVQMTGGSSFTGSLPDILSTDGTFFNIQSVQEPAGQTATARVEVGVNGPITNLRSARLTMAANGPSGGSVLVYLRDRTSGDLRKMRSITLRSSGPNQTHIDLPQDLTDFVEAGKVEISLRAIVPRRPGRPVPSAYEFKLNEVEMKTRPAL